MVFKQKKLRLTRNCFFTIWKPCKTLAMRHLPFLSLCVCGPFHHLKNNMLSVSASGAHMKALQFN